ncbi:beta-defensin-like 1 [Conger conger]|nr:beta-defensin-like 1 [Conger conger]
MKYQCVMLLVVLIAMAFACLGGDAVSFPWVCANYSGLCRPVCLPTELPFGPFSCGKGLV